MAPISLYVALPLLALASLAQADPLPKALTEESCRPYQTDAAGIRPLVERALQARVHELDRRVYFYHYGKNRYPGAGSPIALGQTVTLESGKQVPAATAYFESVADSFFGKRDYEGGLYGAVDPLVTLDFSSQPGLLLRIGVPAGTRYLDLGTLHIPQDEGLSIWCYLQAQCTSADCQRIMEPTISEMLAPADLIQDAHGTFIAKPGELTLKPGLFLPASQQAADLMKGVYQELGIEFTVDGYRNSAFGDCPTASAIEAVFTNPLFSAQIDAKLLAPALESAPSDEKLALYKDVLGYFDAFAFDLKTDQLDGDVVPSFWAYYKAWAPILSHLSSGEDLTAYQRAQSLKMRDSRKNITSGIYGCAGDPNEVAPSK